MAFISLREIRAKETNNFTDPEYLKAYKEVSDEYDELIKKYHQSKEYKERVAKREAEAKANKTLETAEA